MAGIVIEKINKENKNKVVNRCPIFRFATQTEK